MKNNGKSLNIQRMLSKYFLGQQKSMQNKSDIDDENGIQCMTIELKWTEREKKIYEEVKKSFFQQVVKLKHNSHQQTRSTFSPAKVYQTKQDFQSLVMINF